MAQTTTAISAVNAKIEFSADGSSWTDISGSSNSIEPAEQSGASGEAYTFSGNKAVVTAGKTEPVELVVKVLYTPTNGEAFKVVRAQFQVTGRRGYLRWSPAGGASGTEQFTTDAGVLTGLTWPGASADDGKPVPAGFKLKVPDITPSTVA
jgi:hypothetical protein